MDGASERTAESLALSGTAGEEQRRWNMDRYQRGCAMLNLSKRSVQSMRERGELPYTKIEGRIYHRAEDIAKKMEVMMKK